METKTKVFERNGQTYTAIRTKGRTPSLFFNVDAVETVRIELLEGDDRGVELHRESLGGEEEPTRYMFTILRGVEAGQSFAFGLEWLEIVKGGMGDFDELGFFHVVNEMFESMSP